MLRSLYISQFVIIDEIQIDFYDGMSAITGETGAGKSILIDAIGQLLGNRTQSSFVRNGADKAVVEGVFEVDDDFERYCEQFNLHIEEEIVITKEIFKTGKSTIKINYRNASLTLLRKIAPYLVDIHSQFETQTLFSLKHHLSLLDQYIGEDIMSILSQYRILYDDYRNTLSKLEDATNEELNEEQLEYYQNRIQEIDKYPYTDDDINEMENRLERLENYEKTNELIEKFQKSMDLVIPNLDESIDDLSHINDEDVKDFHDNLYNLYYDIKDVYDSVMDYYNSFEFDEYEFNELQETLFALNRLKKKYGYTMKDVQNAKEDMLSKLEIINNRDEYITELEIKLKQLEDDCHKKADEMHQLRVNAAKSFEELMKEEFSSLYLENAVMKVVIQEVELNNNGCDHVVFMISTNKGQSLTPLNETASGGEISRIMLAMKTIILRDSPIDTVIFDEVDSGVSGKSAFAIGDKLHRFSLDKQVICITHLPQVASQATYHYSIEKESDDENTYSSITLLDKEERIEELAKMLSGDKISDEARANAQRLLDL